MNTEQAINIAVGCVMASMMDNDTKEKVVGVLIDQRAFEEEYNYYHVIWHYQALIKAKSFEDMLRLYNQYVCNASDEDLEQNFEFVDRDRAIVMCARAKDDNTNQYADTEELLKDFNSEEECVLLMDGCLA